MSPWIFQRWWLFDATRQAHLDGLVRIGIGRDAAEVAFSTPFGTFEPKAMEIRIARSEGVIHPAVSRCREALVARVVGPVEAPALGVDLPLDIRGTAFQQRVLSGKHADTHPIKLAGLALVNSGGFHLRRIIGQNENCEQSLSCCPGRPASQADVAEPLGERMQ